MKEKIDWWTWIICGLLVAVLLVLINSCALFQPADNWFKPKPKPVSTSPTNQLWQTAKKSNWITTLAIPIIALGAVAAFNGMVKLGMSAAIFGCVNLFMALATARFAMWMAVFGLIGSVVTVGASILVKNKALIEFIKGAQTIKTEIDNGAKPTCSKQINQILSNKQSKPTQKLVQNIKTNLKLKGEI